MELAADNGCPQLSLSSRDAVCAVPGNTSEARLIKTAASPSKGNEREGSVKFETHLIAAAAAVATGRCPHVIFLLPFCRAVFAHRPSLIIRGLNSRNPRTSHRCWYFTTMLYFVCLLSVHYHDLTSFAVVSE